MAYTVCLFGLLLASNALAQQLFLIPNSGSVNCDGLIRPDWQECIDEVNPSTFGATITAGPNFFDGTTFTGTACQLRVIRCAGEGGTTFEVPDIGFGLIRNECRDLTAGGVYRSANMCLLVDDPNNPYFNNNQPDKRADLERVAPLLSVAERAAAEAALAHENHSIKARSAKAKQQRRASLVNSSPARLETRQCPGETCHRYEQSSFYQNIRGPQVRVCDNILPNGARCDQTRSTTTEQSFTASVDIGVTFEEILSVTAGFSSTTSNSVTQSITTAITIDCPNGGSGYIVWYPLTDVTRGRCRTGQLTCDDPPSCTNFESIGEDCELSKPVAPDSGRVSGEYDVQCL